MIFTELRFLAFFLIVFGVYWSLRRHRTRKLFLLVMSWAFYGAWDYRFLSLILFSTVLDFAVGARLEKASMGRARKALLAVSLVGNLGVLGIFKYYNFFVSSASDFLGWLGLGVSDYTIQIILPVGISFYTFQTLSYTIDIYRRTLKPVTSFLDFALFVGFFPQLVAGPIVRASHFLPQLEKPKLFADVDVRACLSLFLIGFIKKGVISDNIAPVLDPVFADPAAFSTASTWIALFLYHAQIYCDFSGYSDMAIATAGLLGYHLPPNFNFPFFARNISEFWQRWHISLSTWFRDYLYTSLGGRRGAGLKAMWVGAATMMLVGLWHGAGWQYVGFGVLMSAAIILSRFWAMAVPSGSVLRRTVRFFGPVIVWYFLFINWICFRSVGWDPAMDMFRIFFFLQPGGAATVDPAWLGVFVIFMAGHTAAYLRLFERFGSRISDWVYAAGYGVASACALMLLATEYQPFIYFQF